MTEQQTYLFVYGTLLKDAANLMTTYLLEKGTLVGKGFFTGQMYAIDFFPGAIYDPDLSSLVYGELFLLKDGHRVLSVLDEYEQFIPSRPEESLFVRKEIPIQLQETSQMAWTYLFNQPTHRFPLIESGDFLAYAKENM